MRLARLLLTIGTLLICPASLLGQAPNPRLIVTLEQGGFAAFKLDVTELEAKSTITESKHTLTSPFAPRVIRDGNILHRMLVDDEGRLMFVYDLVITELESPKRFRVSARPPTRGFDRRLRLQNPDAFAGISESRAQAPTLTGATEQQFVEDGETFALDLLVNEKLGVKVVDYVTVASQRWLLFPSRPAHPPRDFGLSSVELAVKNYQLLVADQPVVSSSSSRNCTGALVWFALPGEGRFIFSLVPYEGYDFRKVGLIEDNRIAFTWKGKSYEWISHEPIVGSGGAWNLWVLHDSEYQDRFMPPEKATPQTYPNRPRVYPDPIGITVPGKKKPDRTALKNNDPTPPPDPVWVTIGGAMKIGDVLPNQ